MFLFGGSSRSLLLECEWCGGTVAKGHRRSEIGVVFGRDSKTGSRWTLAGGRDGYRRQTEGHAALSSGLKHATPRLRFENRDTTDSGMETPRHPPVQSHHRRPHDTPTARRSQNGVDQPPTIESSRRQRRHCLCYHHPSERRKPGTRHQLSVHRRGRLHRCLSTLRTL